MAEAMVFAVAPDGLAKRKIRVWARVPCPNMDVLDHRVILPVRQHGLKIATLDRVVSDAAREIWQRVLRRFRINENVWLVRTMIDGRASGLGEPDRFRLWLPRGRRLFANARRSVVVRLTPPIANAFDTEDPIFTVGGINDRRSDLGRTVRLIGVKPIRILATLDVSGKVSRVIDRRETLCIEVVFSGPPVGERQIIIDGNHVDIFVCPKRVEVKVDFTIFSVTAVLRPICGIGDLCAGEDRTNLCR